MQKPLMSVPRAATWLGVTAAMLRSELAGSDPPPTVRIGARLMLAEADLVAWVNRRRASATAAPSAPQLRQGDKRYYSARPADGP